MVSAPPAAPTARPAPASGAVWILDGLALALAALWLWVTSVPFPSEGVFVVLFLSAVGVLIGWLGRTAALLYRATKHRQSIRPHTVGVLLIPVLALLTGILVATGAPKQARFQLSRAALDRAAEQVIRNDPQAPQDGDRVGLYRVSDAHTIPGGTHMLLEGSGDSLQPCGLAYRPAGRPAGLPFPDEGRGWPTLEGGIYYHAHLGGPWYEVCERIS